MWYGFFVKIEVNHATRALMISLAAKQKKPEEIVLPPVLSSRQLESMSREELVQQVRQDQEILHAIARRQQETEVKLQLVLSLLFGEKADRRKEESSLLGLPLFSEDMIPEREEETVLPEETTEKEKGSSSRGGRKPLEGYTHTVTRTFDVSEEVLGSYREKGWQVRQLPDVTSEYLEAVHVVIRVVEIRKKYALRNRCSGEEKIITAEGTERSLPKAKAGDVFLGDMLYRKYALHMPFNRFSAALALEKSRISRQDLAHWQGMLYGRLKAADTLFREKAFASPVLYCDETTTKRQKSGRCHNYMWIFNAPDFAWFRYFDGRGGGPPLGDFASYAGVVMCDGYGSYPAYLTSARLGICLAHCRRPFVDFRKVTGSEEMVKFPLDCFGELYRRDGLLREAWKAGKINESQFIEERRRQSFPILEKLKAWLDREAVTECIANCALDRAVKYVQHYWERLEQVYKVDVPVELDNNRSERLAKVLVLGRQNWKTHGSEDGAKASALFYSLLETAKLQGLHPRTYLIFLLMETAKYSNGELSTEQLAPLMPWNLKAEDLSPAEKELAFLNREMVPVEETERE